MISPCYIAECNLPPICEKEVLCYAGDTNPTKETLQILRDCIKECKNIFSRKIAYRIFPIERQDDGLCIGSLTIHSKSLEKNLSGCDRVILFAATAGIEIDRYIAKYARLSPSRSLMFHSIGAERIEALCDAFCRFLTDNEGLEITQRFSPGYGDLPLSFQKDFLALLNAGNTVGIGLNDSMLLSPSKSVTAFAGILS